MQPYIAAVANGVLQARVHPCGILKFEFDPVAASVDSLYIQIHDVFATPATSAVPKKVWPAPQALYKEFKEGELGLGLGCFVALSSTEGTYTPNATTGTVAQIEFTQPDTSVTTTTAASAQSLVVWADGSTQHRLFQVRLTRLGVVDATLYLLVAAIGSSQTNIVAAQNISSMITNTQQALSFGTGGLNVFSVKSAQNCRGCSVYISTSPTAIVAPTDLFNLYADYIG